MVFWVVFFVGFWGFFGVIFFGLKEMRFYVGVGFGYMVVEGEMKLFGVFMV